MEEKQSLGTWARIKRSFPTLWKPYVFQFLVLTVLNALLSLAVVSSSFAMLAFYQMVDLDLRGPTLVYLRFGFLWAVAAVLVSVIAFLAAVGGTPKPRVMSLIFLVLVYVELALVSVHLVVLWMPITYCCPTGLS